jgi:hypothetical protein
MMKIIVVVAALAMAPPMMMKIFAAVAALAVVPKGIMIRPILTAAAA